MTESRVAPRTAEVTNCPVCDGTGSTKLFAVGDRLHGTPGEFSYLKCACGSVFQSPMVVQDDLHLCYPTAYYTHDPDFASQSKVDVVAMIDSSPGFRGDLRRAVIAAINGEPSSFAARTLSKSRTIRERSYFGILKDEFLPRRSGRPRAIEIGCGGGNLLVKLESAGWETDGVEWDPEAARVASGKIGREVRSGDFRTLGLERGAFDLVVLHHVFEHLNDPGGALGHLRELLTAEGRIVLVYPNPSSLGARVFGRDWFPWEVPRHLVLPSPRAIAALADRCGLRATWRTSGDFSDFYCANSRIYRRGGAVDEANTPRDKFDFAFKAAEKTLAAAGFAAGDELIVTLIRKEAAV